MQSQKFFEFDEMISEGKNCVNCHWENIKRRWRCGLEIQWVESNVTLLLILLLYFEQSLVAGYC